MEERDEKLIERLVGRDEELKRFINEHKKLERKLEEFNKRSYLTPEEEIERKRIKKLKLSGRDKIEKILSKYR
jgi:uncharacterized protein YdcH (DUF465 family)